LEVRSPDDITRAFSAIRQERSEGLFVILEPILTTLTPRIAEFAVKNRLLTIGTTRRGAEAGFLMAYGANFEDLWRRGATYVDKILRGANPGDLPIEQASKWDFVINLKTAKALDLTIPRSLVLRADQFIE
jgi:putative ABC transport system substrate-binding protein